MSFAVSFLSRPRAIVLRSAVSWGAVLASLAWLAWLVLASFKLTTAPGVNMDEAWSILSARGNWAPADPFSGMTRYSGPFPVLLLKALGTSHAVLMLRGVGLVFNVATVGLLWLVLRRLHPRCRGELALGLGLVATLPTWLAMMRNGIEIGMFGPFLVVLGVYALMRQTKGFALLAGLSFGLLAYNHVVHSFVPVSLAVAWLVVYWRLPPLHWGPLVLGLVCGIAPRLVSLVFYGGFGVQGAAATYSFWAGVNDLPTLPGVFWDTQHGYTVYARFVGYQSVKIYPYYALALGLLFPWFRKVRVVPRHAVFTLVATVCLLLITAVGSLHMAVRFFVLPSIGFALFIVFMAAGLLERAPRFSFLARGVLVLLLTTQVFYVIANFTLPWQRGRGTIGTFFMGERAPNMTSWAFLSKTAVVKHLRAVNPELIVVPYSSLYRPMLALMPDAPIVKHYPSEPKAAKGKSVLVTYTRGNIGGRYCMPSKKGKVCFTKPKRLGKHFVFYTR